MKVSIERMIKQKLELLKKAYKHTEDGYPSHCTPDFNTTAQKPKFLDFLELQKVGNVGRFGIFVFQNKFYCLVPNLIDQFF